MFTARRVVLVLSLFAAGAVYGYAVAWHGVFPAHQIVAAKRLIQRKLTGEPAPKPPSRHAFGIQRDDVMVGDSITASADWDEMFPHAQPANRGETGDTTEDVLRRIDSITALRPKRVFIMVGTNDLAQGDEPWQVLAGYKDIVQALRPAQVFIQSTLPCDPSRRVPMLRESCAEFNRKAAALNTELRQMARREGHIFVDLWPRMADRNGLRPELTLDGLHLNTAGYVAWRDQILPLVEGDASAQAR